MDITTYTLGDGSKIEITPTGERVEGKRVIGYRITLPDGGLLCEGEDLYASPLENTPDEWVASLVSFIRHDAEIFEMSDRGSWGKRYPDAAPPIDEDELCFPVRVSVWAEGDGVKYELEALRMGSSAEEGE